MPWLVGTALIHSLASSEKRGVFKSWTVLLAILAFSLSLLGTFIVRSGVLVSVHAFATDPARGVFILAFLVVVVGGSLALFAWRSAAVVSFGRFQWFSRETALLLNNIIFLSAAAAVFVGTMYPLVVDAFGVGKISVGRPYFDHVCFDCDTAFIVARCRARYSLEGRQLVAHCKNDTAVFWYLPGCWPVVAVSD